MKVIINKVMQLQFKNQIEKEDIQVKAAPSLLKNPRFAFTCLKPLNGTSDQLINLVVNKTMYR